MSLMKSLAGKDFKTSAGICRALAATAMKYPCEKRLTACPESRSVSSMSMRSWPVKDSRSRSSEDNSASRYFMGLVSVIFIVDSSFRESVITVNDDVAVFGG